MEISTNTFTGRAVCLLVLCLLMGAFTVHSFAAGQEFYAMKIYHLENAEQEGRVDKFLQTAFIPALHRQGIKNIGVFKPVGNDTSADRRVFVLIPFNSLNQFQMLNERLEKDKDYNTAGAEYLNAPYNSPPYKRIEVIQLEAFLDMPKMEVPALNGPKAERIYELRSYESATEKLHVNKVDMFNKGGEIKIFKRLGFNAVFYSKVLAGSNMPNLMYMTTFENKASRDAHWKAFGDDADWKRISPLPEYKNNVSKNVTIFLVPAEFSDY